MDIEQMNVKPGQHEISAKVAYLMGIPEWAMQREPQAAPFIRQLQSNRSAGIIRNLCICRSALMRNAKAIRDTTRYGQKGLYSMPDLIPPKALQELEEAGCSFIKAGNRSIEEHIIEINRILLNRINNCKNIFPLWLNWDYIKAFLSMPNGLQISGVRAAMTLFREKHRFYPYNTYANWNPCDVGNLLEDDWKLVMLLYKQNNDQFSDLSKVSDMQDTVKSTIYQFLDGADRTDIVVDCENSDPYKLCAALENLTGAHAEQINKIILLDDVNAASSWDLIKSFTQIPVEYRLVERLNKKKSLVDMALASTVCKEHYRDGISSFILVSSDSDFWELISSLQEAQFLIMAERENIGGCLKQAIRDARLTYCYLDDFYSGNTAEAIKHKVILRDVQAQLDNLVSINLNRLLDTAIATARATVTDAERKQILEKYLRPTISIDEGGNLRLVLSK